MADGDTIVVRLQDGSQETVRLIGIDTPESVHPTQPDECYGPEAVLIGDFGTTLCSKTS